MGIENTQYFLEARTPHIKVLIFHFRPLYSDRHSISLPVFHMLSLFHSIPFVCFGSMCVVMRAINIWSELNNKKE